MPDYLITLVSIVFIFILPGASLIRIFGLKLDNSIEWTFYSLSLSFAIVVAIGVALGNTVGINTSTVIAAFIVASSATLALAAGSIKTALDNRSTLRQTIVAFSRRLDRRLLLGLLFAATVTGFNWYTAVGSHAIDMGEHVFWAKTIIATGRLPDYQSVEPLDQAVKFTYGAHLTLAQFFLVSGVPIEEYTWIPTLIGSIAILAGVVLIAHRLTESKWAALVAAVLYGSAYQPYGYIERGNLPDISGYLLLISTLYSVLRVRKNASFSYPLGLTAVTVIPSHQLATVILPFVLLFAISYSYARSRSELMQTLRSIFDGRVRRLFWVMMILLAVTYASTTTYVSSSAASQLVTGNWRPYVPAFYIDPLVPGATLGLLGIGGVILALFRRTLGFMLLLGWTSALLFLANALVIGIPLPDPLRFLWRLTEPLAILGAVFTYSVLNRMRNTRRTEPTSFRTWVHDNKSSLVGVSLLVTIISVQIAGLAIPVLEGTPGVFSLPPRYLPSESFYQDDKMIGQWLASNAQPSAVTTNDADVDPTATWVQVYSMKLHFTYRADFAAIVAPANYIQIYKAMAILYESPGDARVPMIIQQYDIGYVVAHTDEIALFSSATCFGHGPIFRAGGSALFATTPC